MQQQPGNELKQYTLQLQIALEQMGTTMQIIVNQKEEIAELRKHIADVENQQQEQREYINIKLEERDRKLLESIREIQETKEQIAATQQKKSQLLNRKNGGYFGNEKRVANATLFRFT